MDRMMKAGFGWWLALALGCLSGCGEEDTTPSTATAANLVVQQRIAALAPAAVFAHRGQGPTRSGNPYPENSLSAFRAAIAQGSDGIEMDAEITEDGRLVLMHDDTLNRTTECTGCVSQLSFEAIRRCRLLDGSGAPTSEVPPTMEEVFALSPSDVLVNVELKVFGGACLTPGHGPIELAQAMVATLRRLGVEQRTVVQSFDAEALTAVKAEAPDIYTAYLVSGLRPADIAKASEIAADALQPGGPFPFLSLNPTLLRGATDAGLQLIPWTVNDAASINTLLDGGVNGIITDDPVLAKQIVAGRR